MAVPSPAPGGGSRLQTAVVIVGGGPVGLALANELGWRGVDCIVVERATAPPDFPTCESVNARTLEHFRRWGIANAVRNAGFPPDIPRSVRFMTRILGHELLCFERPSNRDFQKQLGDLTPEAGIWCPRMLFEPVMRNRLEQYPQVRQLNGWEVTGFDQSDSRVIVQVRELATGTCLQIDALYLAACDGAASETRKRLGIGMEGAFAEGHNVTVYFESAALRDALVDKPGVMMDIANVDGRANLSAVDGDSRWRLIQHVQPDEALDPERRVRTALGRDLEFKVIGARAWAGHRVVAERMRVDRAFLVGDSAHLLWPRGGFGMNTGIGDAVDLGWKLQAVLGGWGGAALLDTYEQERRPVATRNVNEAASNREADAAVPVSALLEADSPEGAAERAAVAAVIRAKRAKEWNSLGIQLGYRYDPSAICIPDGVTPPPESPTDYVPGTWPGSRAPHAWLREGVSTLDLYGRGFVLLSFGDADAARSLVDAADLRGVPLQVVPVDDASVFRLYQQRYVLVRPDGHVAWRGAKVPEDPLTLVDRVRGAGIA
jgi:2-polyprenyl-6-methoxyphenol hydroxylase-like FAD-dependent oxidoreductase